MKNNGIITLSSVPTDIEQAKLLKAKIDNHRVTLHPDQAEKILGKLQQVLAGKSDESEEPQSDSNFLLELEEPRKRAREREEKRNQIREPLKVALLALEQAEIALKAQNGKYQHQYNLTKSKLSLLKILTSLESESHHILERNLISEF